MSFLRILHVTDVDFTHFVLFGDNSIFSEKSNGDNDSLFLIFLENCAACYQGCKRCDVHRHVICHSFFMAYFCVVYFHIEASQKILAYLQNFLFKDPAIFISHGFEWAIKKFMFYVFQIYYGHPLIRLNVSDLENSIFIKKKCDVTKERNAHSLAVPPPSSRLQSTDKMIKLHFLQMSSDDLALYHALSKSCDAVPCGNPFECMVKCLTFQSIIFMPYGIIPIGCKNLQIVNELYLKYLKHSILNCIISIPVIHQAISNVIKTKGNHIPIVYCQECRHCLNFGKGKFLKVNFKPTEIFYCRDQKEKQCNICSTTGRIYCSYCGSNSISITHLTEYTQGVCKLRAVVANNAAIMTNDIFLAADFLLPCLGNKGQCNNVILKKLRVVDLLYLTTTIGKLFCSKCSAT